MALRIDNVVTSGIFTLDGEDFEVDNNIWLVGDDDEVIVVDAAHDHRPIVAGVGSRRVVAVVCTHGHNDHINAAVPLAEAVGAPIWVHPDDRMLWDVVWPERAPDAELADGQVIEVGGSSLEVLHTPGHSPGRLLPARRRTEGVLFSGDTLFNGGPGATGRSFSDYDTIVASIRSRLLDLAPGDRGPHRPRRRHHHRRRSRPLDRLVTVEVRGVDLAVEDTGTGTPVLWGHGLTSSMAAEAAMGMGVADLPEDRYRLIRYDARGHGESGATADPGGLRLPVAGRRPAGVGRCARHRPLRVRRDVHGDRYRPARRRGRTRPGAGAGPRHPPDRLGGSPGPRRHLPGPGPGHPRARGWRRSSTGPWPSRWPRSSPPSPTWSGPASGTATRTTTPRCWRRCSPVSVAPTSRREDAIATLTMPVLVLAWQGDPVHPEATAERLAELLPQAELVSAASLKEVFTWKDRVVAFLDEALQPK